MSVATALRLPRASGAIEPYTPGAPSPYGPPAGPPRSRVAFAAAHVVADPLAAGDPGGPAQLDWEATLAFRRHLWEHGFAVAEARAVGGTIAAGAGTDHLTPSPDLDLAVVRAAYEEQC
ncbi:MAG: DUF993 family protein, partial [Solirubrobacteraceae bacterium]